MLEKENVVRAMAILVQNDDFAGVRKTKGILQLGDFVVVNPFLTQEPVFKRVPRLGKFGFVDGFPFQFAGCARDLF